MIALVVATSTASLLLLGGIVVALGLAVLVAHWASYRPPSAKRLVSHALAACLVSLVLLMTTPAPAGAQASLRKPPAAQVRTLPQNSTIAQSSYEGDDGGDDFMMQDPCKKYGPEHPMWWVAGCMWP